MKNIILLDTAIGTTNKGDDIIMKSAVRGLQEILEKNYVVNIPTHITPFSWFQTHFWWKAKWVKEADLKFICGTNLLAKSLRYPINDFNIQLWNCGALQNTILVGVGNSLLDKKIDGYTRIIYNKVLSHDLIHSTRDDETTEMLESMGFKAVTTGCVTLWGLTPELCSRIPDQKADEVVFTLTGPQRDEKRDQKLLDILKKNYKKRYFYIQTIWDMEYFTSLKGIEDVEIISPDISIYESFLNNHDVDYVGTRLHGGIFAMQHEKRSIILTIDNRARNISKVNHLNTLERERIDELDSLINTSIKTNVKMNYEVLNYWKNQFIEKGN